MVHISEFFQVKISFVIQPIITSENRKRELKS